MTDKGKNSSYNGFRRTGIRLTEEILPDIVVHSSEHESPLLYACHKFDKAHLVSLSEENILSKEHAALMLSALREMEAEGVAKTRLAVGGGIHSGEQYLIRKLSEDIGGKIHLGRSSGDIDKVADRIKHRDELLNTMQTVNGFRESILKFASDHVHTIMPGYTHAQQAQPLTLGHQLAAWAAVAERDFQRLLAVLDRINVSPAGAAIMTGSNFSLNRHRTAELLGFDRPCANTLDAVHSPDDILEIFSVIALLHSNLSRWSEDIILWSSTEVGMVDIPDRFCGTSSILVQKKNPYALEHIRGAASATVGGLMSAFMGEKGQTGLSVFSRNHYYKQTLLTSFKNVVRDLTWLTDLVPGLTVHVELMKQRAGEFWAQATDIAGAIVKEKGLSWRTAHQITGILVRRCMEHGIRPEEVTVDHLNEAAVDYLDAPLDISPAVLSGALDPVEFVNGRDLYGGPAPQEVSRRIADFETNLNSDKDIVVERRRKLELADKMLEAAIDQIVKEQSPQADQKIGVTSMTRSDLGQPYVPTKILPVWERREELFEIAIDTGGTFTDGVLIDEQRKSSVAKFPSNSADPEKSLMGCIGLLAKERGLSESQLIAETNAIVIGTTIATNSVVSKKGSKCCMITTRGFRDMLELSSRIPKRDPYDLRIDPPEFLIPRYLRYEVEERTQFDGKILTPLNEDDVRKAVKMAKDQGVEAPVVCFLHSYMNPENEEKAAEIIKETYPNVILSSHILRMRMEGYRFHTATLAAYVQPQIANFVQKLDTWLKSAHFKGTLLFVTCAGGVAAPSICLQNPALMIGSGPAAGPLFAKLLGDLGGFEDMASIDIGGTTADLCVLPRGSFSITTEMIVAGHRNAMASVDVDSVGVGGGAIAQIDHRGILCVGPESAGADPGPACYGKGGIRPTLTDANVVLGYVPADYFLGGDIPLYPDLAHKAIREVVAEPLGIDVIEAAHSIVALAEENIAKETLLCFVQKGYDPRDFTLVVGGGAGPAHGAVLADKLNMKQAYIPRHAALFCPFGILLADYKYLLSRFYYRSGNEIELDGVKSLFMDLETEGVSVLKQQGLGAQEMVIVRGASMRYFGQLHSLDVSLPETAPGQPFTDETLKTLIQGFHDRHHDIYGRSDPAMPVTIENLKLHAVGKRRPFEMTRESRTTEDAVVALKRHRPVYFKSENGFKDTACYDGRRLKFGHMVQGPAIIEETKTTIVVPQGHELEVDAYGNYMMRRR